MKTLICLIMFSTAVFAEQNPCAAEIKKVCGEAKGAMAKLKCIGENKKNFSPDCQEKMAQRKENRQEMRKARHSQKEACAADFKKFCSDVQGGHGARLKCLEEHHKDFSSECQAQREKLKNLRNDRKRK
jgi:hypothetical protein